jgi:hypothetical protein
MISQHTLCQYAKLAKAAYDIPKYTVGDSGIFHECDDDELRISITGTHTFNDILADFNIIPKYSEHRGFSNYADECVAPLIETINKYNVPKITIIGHSLGGAVSQLVAKRIKKLFPQIKVISFGSPKCYLRWCAPKQIEHIRVFHCADPIPKLLCFLYAHSSTMEIGLGADGIDIYEHSLNHYIKLLEQENAF